MTADFSKFDIESFEELDEQTLHRALSQRIEDMLAFETELLFSTLYRLDVREKDIKIVLRDQREQDIAAGLARLVIERQKEKNASKGSHSAERMNKIDDVEFDS